MRVPDAPGHRPLGAAFAALLVVALTAPALPQDWKGVGRLEGTVLDADGRPVADAAVKLHNPSRGGGTTVKTDKKGRWALAGIAPGEWTVEVTAAGHEPHKGKVTLASETTRLSPLAVRLLRAAPKGPPPEVLAALTKAEDAFKEGRWAAAVAEYQRLLVLRPDLSTTIHRQLGLAYREQKDYENALAHLQKVLDADPANVQARTFMVRAALEGGMLERARTLLAGIDESAVKRPDLFHDIGVALLNANRPEEAIAYFTKAVTLDPAFAEGYFRRALAHLQLLRVPECKADLQRVLERVQDGPVAEAARQTLEQLK
jgi:Flp pilus assembly protein TadD